MPTLPEQLNTSLGGVDISVSIGGEAQKIINIAEIAVRLIDNPPDEFGDFLSLLSEIDLPQLDIAGDLGSTFDTLRDLIPADLSELNGGLLENLDNLESTTLAGVTDVIQPAIDAITAFTVLFKGDLSCGLIDGFMGSPEADSGGSPASPPTPAPAPQPGDPNPGPQNPVVSQSQIDEAKAVIDHLPTPMTIENLLPWLAQFWGNNDIPYNILRAVPFIDDLRGPLATITAWQEMNGSDIIDNFAATLTQTATLVQTNSVDLIDQSAQELNDLLTPLDTNSLGSAFDDLTGAWNNIAAALSPPIDISGISGDITTANSAISTLQAQHAVWSASVQAALELQMTRHGVLGDRLEDHLVQLVSLLQPRPAIRDLFGGEPPATLNDSNADLAGLQEVFEQIESTLDRILDSFDLEALFEPITEPFEQASEVVEQINQQIVALTLEVQNRLSSLNDAIDTVDLSSLQTAAGQGIDDFSNQLQSGVSSQFAPVRTAFESVINELVAAVDGFDPASLKSEVEDVINRITGVLGSGEVQQALEQLQQLTDIGESIDSISFEPLTDTVIDGIDEIKTALDSIDESSLDPPLPQMLGAAMSVLPDDVTPLTNPLMDRLDELIEAGPINLIEQIKLIPQQLFDQIRQYGPETLIGDSLSKPYDDLLEKVRDFSPANILDQVEQEFDKSKKHIKDVASPGQVLQPLVSLHQQLMVELAKLNPGELIEPLDQKIQSVMQTLGESIDLSAVLDPLSQITEEVNRQTDQVKKGLELVQHLLGKLGHLADAPAQIETWIDSLFDKIPDNINTSALTTPLSDLASAIEATRQVNLQGRINTKFSPLQTLFTELNAAARLAAMVQASSSVVRSEVEALPNSPQKSDLLALLSNFNVTDAEISGPMQQIASLAAVHAELEVDLTARFSGWDARYHSPNGTLDSFNQSSVDLVQIKTWLREAIDRQIAWPLEAVFGKVAVLKGMLEQIANMLSELCNAIDEKIVALLSAPQALLDIGEEVQALIDTVASINLDFLQNSINEIFDTVREKFNQLNPAPVQQALDENFAEIIDGIDFDLIIPPNSLDSLTTAYDSLLQDLEGLSPDTLLVEPLQQSFEEQVQPFIDSLDVTPLLQAVIDRLAGLDDELREEMDRVNSSYQEMLAAAPDTGLSVGI